MNSLTIAIPTRWDKATEAIVGFLENRLRLKTASIDRFRIKLTPSIHEERIVALKSTLDAAQAIFCDAALLALNTALNGKTSDGWRATKEITEQAHRDVDEIEYVRALATAPRP